MTRKHGAAVPEKKRVEPATTMMMVDNTKALELERERVLLETERERNKQLQAELEQARLRLGEQARMNEVSSYHFSSVEV